MANGVAGLADRAGGEVAGEIGEIGMSGAEGVGPHFEVAALQKDHVVHIIACHHSPRSTIVWAHAPLPEVEAGVRELAADAEMISQMIEIVSRELTLTFRYT